jgi:TetR/AcrR family fatty acid metabolism transcriptional regulator
MATATDKRRQILDAGVRVFSRQGFHTCRVSDIADEAGVAYGLVYHYFASKDQILDTLFLERWDVMLAAITDADESELSPREKLYACASFVVESYGHEPDLMKVIIVEVTRAANTFGRTHQEKIEQAYAGVAAIVAGGQRDGSFRATVDPTLAGQAFFGLVEQVLTAWIFAGVPVLAADLEQAKQGIVDIICGGLEV